jgi:[methyl-Co(III) methanol-specific corrinoid protein]:coenzyme M methyltransferase
VTGDLAGPHHYRDLLQPLHRELTAEIGGPLILHVCGNCNDRLELFADAGFDAYHFEWQMDAVEVVKRIGERVSLVGCVNNAQVLYQGKPEDAYQQARYAIEAGVNIIGPECAIPLSTPLENLKAIVAAAGEGY